MKSLLSIIGILGIAFGVVCILVDSLGTWLAVECFFISIVCFAVVQVYTNQEKAIEAVRKLQCPHLFYLEYFVPQLLKKYAEANGLELPSKKFVLDTVRPSINGGLICVVSCVDGSTTVGKRTLRVSYEGDYTNFENWSVDQYEIGAL